jgi:cystine transport system substrate-binding protein
VPENDSGTVRYALHFLVGVTMKLALLGRQALMGVMAVALVAGMSVKTFAAENLLNKVKERGTLLVGLEGTYPPFSFQGDDGKLTGLKWSLPMRWRNIWA